MSNRAIMILIGMLILLLVLLLFWRCPGLFPTSSTGSSSGSGSGGSSATPVITPTSGAPGPIAAVHAGGHSCALLSGGAVRCWGSSFEGQLGYANTATIGDDESPAVAGNVQVGGTVSQIAVGRNHTCALLDGGAVRCWGNGDMGRLGYGNTDIIGDDETPASAGDVVVGGTVKQLAAGENHVCALLDSGAVRCWGASDRGQLGYGNTNTIGDDETPASAGDVPVGGTVTQVAAGDRHTCALLDTGAVRCWGWGHNGMLGYGNTDDVGDDETPASVGDVDVGGTATLVAAGSNHSCALLDTGAVRCWGGASHGQLGYGNLVVIGDDEAPATAGDVDLGGPATDLAVGSLHNCALLGGGALRCWGIAFDGRLGYGNTDKIGDDEAPASAGDVDVGGGVRQVSTGGRHTCALLDSGAVRCWGHGVGGQLGYGSTDNVGDDEAPAAVGDVQVL